MTTGERDLPALRRRTQFWRSPAGQPPWARPALLLVAALAAVAYAWGIGNVNLEPFYGGAARSMSESWRNFFFGAVDPWGTIAVDKLPGALWVQAISLRIFGFHLWAIALPQVIEGTLTVLVIYRAVRRVAGPVAGIGAAIVLAISPSTVLLNRGNISDSLLILLLVLAADATTKAIATGKMGSLILAGLWVGLAFQTKMAQAWLVLPALYLAYLIAAPAKTLARRAGHVAMSIAVVAVVSLSWVTVVSAVPTHDRPYVDGSCDDSVFSQVFLYNGIDRLTGHELDQAGCTKPWAYENAAFERGLAQGLNTASIPAGWNRLLKGVFGRDDAWMVIPSLAAAIGLLLLRRRRSRTDPIRAATLLWTAWLLITGVFFSSGQYLNSYYVAALIPAMAALCGMGAAAAWAERDRLEIRITVMAVVIATTIYSLILIPTYVGIRTLIVVSLVTVAVLALAVLAVSLSGTAAFAWTLPAGLALASLVLVLSPAFASSSAVISGQGPFDSPYEPASVTYFSQILPERERSNWPTLNAEIRLVPANVSVETIQGSAFDGYEIMATGREFLPVGGFSGRVPAPSLSQFVDYVEAGRISVVLVAVAPLTDSPDMRWVVYHCYKRPFGRSNDVNLGTRFELFSCMGPIPESAGSNSQPVRATP